MRPNRDSKGAANHTTTGPKVPRHERLATKLVELHNANSLVEAGLCEMMQGWTERQTVVWLSDYNSGGG